MELTTLKTDINAKARNHTDIISDLSKAYNVHVNSVQRWFQKDSPKLITIDSLSIISHHLNIPIKDLTVSNKTSRRTKIPA